MRLWQIPFSTNVLRVALVLAHKGLDAEPVLVDAADRSAVRARSGQDLVPILETDDGAVLTDSLRIATYLEERFPARPLYPAGPRREEVLVFLDWFDRVWKRPPNLLADAIAAGRSADEPELAAWAAELRGSLPRFEALLEGRNFLFGGALGIADVAVYPFLRYGVGPDEQDDDGFHRILVGHLCLGQAYPRLHAWIKRCEGLPRAGLIRP